MTTAADNRVVADPRPEGKGRKLGELARPLSWLAGPSTSDPIPVQRVAEYLLHDAADDGRRLDFATLQRLCAVGQAYHLADWGRPFFNEAVETGPDGPLIPALNPLYASCGDASIPPPGDDNLPLEFSHFMQPTLLSEVYHIVTHGWPAPLSRRDEPWHAARREHGNGAAVEHDAMRTWAKREIREWLEKAWAEAEAANRANGD